MGVREEGEVEEEEEKEVEVVVVVGKREQRRLGGGKVALPAGCILDVAEREERKQLKTESFPRGDVGRCV